MYCNDVSEQILITKEHIIMHTNLILWFNPLYTQVLLLVIKLFKVKLYEAVILTVPLQVSLPL